MKYMFTAIAIKKSQNGKLGITAIPVVVVGES